MADKTATIYEPIDTDLENITLSYVDGEPTGGSIVVRVRTNQDITGMLARVATLTIASLPEALQEQLIALATEAVEQAASELGF